MGINIKLIVALVGLVALGGWYIMAGIKGWKYPRLRSEFDDDNEKIVYRLLKIVVGAGCIIFGIGGIITEFITHK